MAGKSIKSDSGNADISSVNAGNDVEQISNIGGENVIDPASIAGTGDGYGDEYERDDAGNLVYGASGKPRRKRGRRPGANNIGRSGSTNKSSAGNNKTLKDGIDTLSKTLMVLHMGIASYAKFDGFNLDEKEADALSASIVNVMDQFDWTPDPRMTAIAGLVTTSATIYGPRAYLYRMHLIEKAKEKRNKDNTVIDMTGHLNVN